MAVNVATNGAVGGRNSSTTTTTPLTLTFPSSHTATAGNLLFLIVGTSHATRAPAGSGGTGTPGGFTLISTHTVSNASNKALRTYGKVAAGGETGVSVYLDSTTATGQSAFLYEVTGSPASDVVAATAGYFGPNTGSASTAVTFLDSTSLNPTETGDVLFIDTLFLNGTTGGSEALDSSFANILTDGTVRSFSGRLIITNPGATVVRGSWTNTQTALNLLVAIPSSGSNASPTADAGPDQTSVTVGDTVNLDGTGSSDPEDSIGSLTFAWTVTDPGSTGMTTGDITGASTTTPTIDTTGMSPGVATIQLQVTDTGALSDTDTMTVQLISPPPSGDGTPTIRADGAAAATAFGASSVTATFPSAHVAVAGDLLMAFVVLQTTATINTPTGWTSAGTVTANSNRRLSLFVKKAIGDETGVTVTQSGTTGRFETHVFDIREADVDAIIADPTILFANLTDFATAETNSAGTAVTTLATASINPTSTGDVLMFAFLATINSYGTFSGWSNGFATASTISGTRSIVGTKLDTDPAATSTSPSWTTANQASALIVQVPPSINAAPVANAGLDQTRTIGSTVTLDGTGSTDDIDDPADLTYSWAVTSSGTTGVVTGDITGPTTDSPTIDTTGASEGTFVVTLTVTDTGSLTDTDTVSITLVDPVLTGTGVPRKIRIAGSYVTVAHKIRDTGAWV